MAISLKKGQGVRLKKSDYDLSLVTIGLGWDVAASYKTVQKVAGQRKIEVSDQVIETFQEQEKYDLDVVAFLCNKQGKVKSLGHKEGKSNFFGGDIVYFNSMFHHSGCVWLTCDNRTGKGNGDDEQIICKLNDLSEEYSKIVFVVQIYRGMEQGQTFGKIQNAFIRAVDNRGKEMIRFELSGGTEFSLYCSMLFAELVREPDGWKFNAIGSPNQSDSFVTWLKQYR